MATINGTSGAETLTGTAGSDSINALGGDDTLFGTAGTDTLNGGSGTDVASYTGAAITNAIVVNYDVGSVTKLQGGSDTLINIERVRGSGFNDTLNGSTFEDTAIGSGGDDSFNGNGGLDVMSYASPSGFTGVVVSANAGNATVVKSGTMAGTDTLVSVEFIRGTIGNDSFTGNTGNETFFGGDGNDVYDGGAGTFDQLSYHSWGNDSGLNSIVVDYGPHTVTKSNGGGVDSYTNIEQIQGTPNSDRFNGSTFNDTFVGSSGQDTYIGGGGNDFLGYFAPKGSPTNVRVDMTLGTVEKWKTFVTDPNGATGPDGGTDFINNINSVGGTGNNDFFRGGDPTHSVFGALNTAEVFSGFAGNDTIVGTDDGMFGGTVFVYANYAYVQHGISVALGTGTANIDINDVDTLDHVTGIMGTNFDDSLTGGGSYKTPWGGAFDALAPQAGNDTVVGVDWTFDRVQYNNSTRAMTVDLRPTDSGGDGFADNAFTGSDTLTGGDHDILRGSIEQIYTGSGNDTLFGSNNHSTTFIAGFGNNVIHGGTGGEDRMQYNNFLNVHGITAHLDTGLIQHDNAAGTLDAETDTVDGIEGVLGTRFDDVFFAATDSHDTGFEGNAGNDTFNGASGTFTFLTYQRSPDAITVDMATHTVADGWGGTDSFTNIQGVSGSMFDDVFIGSAGDDAFQGMAGFDSFDGGLGRDMVSYGDDPQGDPDFSAQSGVNVNLLANSAIDGWGYEDFITKVEDVEGSSFSDLITGNNVVNSLRGRDGNDALQGLGGADNLEGGDGNDTLEGGTGLDVMTGGLGDDVYVIDNFREIANELAGEGQDSIGLKLLVPGFYDMSAKAAQVEDVYMVGGVNMDLLGNSLNNWIRGNAGINDIQGGSGNDTIIGAGGNDLVSGGSGFDVLTGGGGADAFVFTAVLSDANADLITDFKSGMDHLDLKTTRFAAAGATNFETDDARFFLGNAAHDADDRIVYDQFSGRLYYDADGTGAGAQQWVATLSGHPTVVATDIHIVT